MDRIYSLKLTPAEPRGQGVNTGSLTLAALIAFGGGMLPWSPHGN